MCLINTDVNNSGTLGRRDEPITKFNDFKLLKHSLKGESVSCSVMSNSVMLWTVAGQTSLFMGFPRQDYWSGLPFPSPGDLPDPGIESTSPSLQADSLSAFIFIV